MLTTFASCSYAYQAFLCCSRAQILALGQASCSHARTHIGSGVLSQSKFECLFKRGVSLLEAPSAEQIGKNKNVNRIYHCVTSYRSQNMSDCFRELYLILPFFYVSERVPEDTDHKNVCPGSPMTSQMSPKPIQSITFL